MSESEVLAAAAEVIELCKAIPHGTIPRTEDVLSIINAHIKDIERLHFYEANVNTRFSFEVTSGGFKWRVYFEGGSTEDFDELHEAIDKAIKLP